MSPARLLLSLLALVGSLDTGFSFASANGAPFPSSTFQTHSVIGPSFNPRSMATTTATTKTAPLAASSSTRQRRFGSALSLSSNAGLSVTGGDDNNSSSKDKGLNYQSPSVFFASLWGAGGVIYILAKAIKRVIPIAMEPFTEGAVPLSQVQLGIYVVTCLWFAYVEGYKGFQTKFSPLVVKRSLTLQPGKSGIHHFLLAPLYSMGLFHASKKRKIVSWSVTIGVAAIVAAVKRLPYPWRNIVDAGVVAGLTWGSLSIVAIYLKAWIFGKPPTIDPALP